jgi:rhodanese-related sulfurtransferase
MLSREFDSTFIVSNSTPSFYPDPKDLMLEVYFDRNTRELLGAEAFGEVGVDKRIDVLSTAILGKLTVDDLTDLDLAYAPPFSPAKDPVIVAGFVSGDKANSKFNEISPDTLEHIIETEKHENYQLIDVRTPLELEKLGAIAKSKNIELDALRSNLDKLDKKKHIIFYCARGLRGYVATMILLNHGFSNVSNLGGGFLAWKKFGMDVQSVIQEKSRN